MPDGCVDVPGILFQKASSIDTHDNCVVLYSEDECKGHSVVVAPGTSGHSDLDSVNFDNLLASLKPCGDHHNATKKVDNATVNTTAQTTTTSKPSTAHPTSKDTVKPENGHKRDAREAGDDKTENKDPNGQPMKKKEPNITLSYVIY